MIWVAHEAGRDQLEPLPAGVSAHVFAADAPLPADPAEVEFWVPPFLSGGPGVIDLAGKMPRLRVVQLLTAGADAWVGRLPSGVTLCDARGVHDSATAEWVVAAILASLRRFDYLAQAQQARRWAYGEVAPTDELAGKRVLIVGAGSIGTALAARLAPFEVDLTMVARTAREGSSGAVHGIAELPRLLPHADVVVLLVPLTPQTRGMVDAGFLAAMADGALLVNAARGPVADLAALTAEVESGRLCAALDVTDPEPLPAAHPLWQLPNVLLTPHVAGSVRGMVPRAYRLVRAQLGRYLAGDALLNEVRDGY